MCLMSNRKDFEKKNYKKWRGTRLKFGKQRREVFPTTGHNRLHKTGNKIHVVGLKDVHTRTIFQSIVKLCSIRFLISKKKTRTTDYIKHIALQTEQPLYNF